MFSDESLLQGKLLVSIDLDMYEIALIRDVPYLLKNRVLNHDYPWRNGEFLPVSAMISNQF